MASRGRIALGVVLAGVALGGAVAAHLPGASTWIDPRALAAVPDATTTLLAFLAAQIVIAAFGFVPASFAAIAAGATFGLVRGFFVSACGILVGGWIAFVLARSLLRPLIAWIVARHPAFARFETIVASGDWKVVCLMRMSPVMPFALTSYGLGLTQVSHRSFVVGMLASLPSLLCYVALGALGKTGLAVGESRVGLLHGIVLAGGALSMVFLALRLAAWLRAGLGSAAALNPSGVAPQA